MQKSFILIIILCTLLVACKSKNVNSYDSHNTVMSEMIDSTLLSAIDEEKIQGAISLISRKDKIVYYKAVGQSDIELNKPQKKDDIFRLASMTKPITAVAAMILYEEGKYSLDNPISKFIPEFKNPQILDNVNMDDSTFTAHPAKNEITVRQLFTHSTGIGYGFQDDKLMALYEKAGITEGFEERDISLKDNTVKIAGMPIMHEPGSRFTYGLNSDVLGGLIEIWSGMSLDEFFSKRIFEPLGMKDTYFYLPESKYDRLIPVYMNSEKGVVKTEYPLTNYPVKGAKKYLSGGADLSSTIYDYYLFCQMLANLGELNGERILKPETVQLMTMTQLETGDEDMGLGLSVLSAKTNYKKPRSVGTYSGGGFFATTFWIDPQEDIIAILFLQLYPFDYWDDVHNAFEDAVYVMK